MQDFNRNAPTWAMLSAHLCAFTGFIHAFSMLSDLSQIGMGIATAVCSYIYGGILAAVLPFRLSNAHEKWHLRTVDFLIPGFAFAALFFVTVYALWSHGLLHLA